MTEPKKPDVWPTAEQFRKAFKDAAERRRKQKPKRRTVNMPMTRELRMGPPCL